MNVNTGELRRIAIVGDGGAGKKALKALVEQGFTPVPEVLEPDADKLLQDKEVVMVDLKEKTSLTRWAEKVRNEKHKQGRNEK